MDGSDKIRTWWPRSNFPKRNRDDSRQFWLTNRSPQARNLFACMAYFLSVDACHV